MSIVQDVIGIPLITQLQYDQVPTIHRAGLAVRDQDMLDNQMNSVSHDNPDPIFLGGRVNQDCSVPILHVYEHANVLRGLL